MLNRLVTIAGVVPIPNRLPLVLADRATSRGNLRVCPTIRARGMVGLPLLNVKTQIGLAGHGSRRLPLRMLSLLLALDSPALG